MRVVVLGAGLLGLTSAYYLERAGQSVVVLEREDGPGLGTSYANGGLLHASLVEPWNAPGILGYVLRSLGREDAAMLLRLRALPSLAGWGLAFLRNSSPEPFRRNTRSNLALAQLSLREMQRLRAETRLEYQQSLGGAALVFRSEPAAASARREVEALAEFGVIYEWLDRAALIAREPALAPVAGALAGALYYPADEVGDAHLYCRELAALLATRGVEFRYRTTVDGFERQGGRLGAARTAAGPVAGDAFVLACGSDSVALAKGLGLRLPVRPAKGYSITLARHDGDGSPQLPMIDSEMHVAITPLGHERLRVVGTAELAGFDRSIRPARIRNLLRVLELTLPRFAARIDHANLNPWAGLRPMSADGVPLIGATAIENLFLNTGHGHLGWTMAAGSARLLSEALLGGTPALPLADYRLDRA